MYLLDTSFISELRKGPRAHPGVRTFMAAAHQHDEACFLSVVTVGEIRKGIERLRLRGDEVQMNLVETWLGEVLEEFAPSILEFDLVSAQIWGVLAARHTAEDLDLQLAATALARRLSVVTRNVRDFRGLGVAIVNPFDP